MQHTLADLHVHLFGAITAESWHRRIRERNDIDWSWYEANYTDVYGESPNVRALLAAEPWDPQAAGRWRRLFEFGAHDAGSFDRFQAKFNLLIASSALARVDGTPARDRQLDEELRSVVAALAARQRADGVGHAEHRMMFGPRHGPQTVRRASSTLLDAMRSVTGTTMRLALSLPRDNPWPTWRLAQQLALGEFGDDLTAIDLCGTEEGHPPKNTSSLLRDVLRFNREHPNRALAILVHVGESFRDKSLESAVRWVHEVACNGAHRLGHALALALDPDVMGDHRREERVGERRDQIAYDLQYADSLREAGVTVDSSALQREQTRLAAHEDDEVISIDYDIDRREQVRRRQAFAMRQVRALGTVIEVCPTSNLRVAGLREPSQHPLRRMLSAGLRVVIGSDDPGLFGTSLARELVFAGEALDIDAPRLAHLRAAAWAHRSERLVGRPSA